MERGALIAMKPMVGVSETNHFGIDRRRSSRNPRLLNLFNRNVFVEIAIQTKPWRTQPRGAFNPRGKAKSTFA
jgi:hypothetical protein